MIGRLFQRAARATADSGRSGMGRWAVGLLLAAAAVGFAPRASGDALPEYRLKAAFLYNFAAFTEWPASVGTTLNVCVLGTDPFGVEIDGLDGKVVGTRVLAIHRRAGVDAIKGCQIIFATSMATGQWPRLLDAVRGSPVLVVADSPGAARQGAALNMSVAQGRVTFEANLEAARGAGLTLSSKLLRLATEVIQ